jgi:hypothetical protein
MLYFKVVMPISAQGMLSVCSTKFFKTSGAAVAHFYLVHNTVLYYILHCGCFETVLFIHIGGTLNLSPRQQKFIVFSRLPRTNILNLFSGPSTFRHSSFCPMDGLSRMIAGCCLTWVSVKYVTRQRKFVGSRGCQLSQDELILEGNIAGRIKVGTTFDLYTVYRFHCFRNCLYSHYSLLTLRIRIYLFNLL